MNSLVDYDISFSYIWYLYILLVQKMIDAVFLPVTTKFHNPYFQPTPILDQELVIISLHDNQSLLKLCGVYVPGNIRTIIIAIAKSLLFMP